MIDNICIASVSSGEVINTYRNTLFGADNISEDAAIDNQLIYQNLKTLIEKVISDSDETQLYSIADNSEYSIRCALGHKSSYVKLYIGKIELCEFGICNTLVAPYILDVWQNVGGQGLPPNPPYTAVNLKVDSEFVPAWLIKFTKILSWVIYDQFDIQQVKS